MTNQAKMAKVKCPKCQHQTEVEVLQNACLPMYKCDGCKELITIPKESENCCVVCEYSKDQCPMPNLHKK